MTKLREDDRLRERFDELRAEVEGSGTLPEFGAMLTRARAEAADRPTFGVLDGGAAAPPVGGWSTRRFARAGVWGSVAVAATVAALLLTDRRPRNDDEFLRVVAAYTADASGGAWRSPTSRLLEVPGMELVRSVPDIGRPVRGVDPAALPEPEASPPEENL